MLKKKRVKKKKDKLTIAKRKRIKQSSYLNYHRLVRRKEKRHEVVKGQVKVAKKKRQKG